MATITVDGVELYYESRGAGDCLVLTHGSWTDATGWQQAVAHLTDRYRVVIWDRRGHSRSQAGKRPGSRAEDAADLARLIEHVSSEPVHVVGNSYGANVTLTLVAARPDLTATAALHEPPLWGLLEGTPDPRVVDEMSAAGVELDHVRELIRSDDHRRAAQHFIERVALGPGTWEQLPEAFRAVLEGNAPTFLDELADDTALSIDAAAVASIEVPMLLTHGTESPELFPAVIAELVRLVPTARVEVLEGAGHIPHITNTEDWVAQIVAFHEAEPCRPYAPIP